MKLIIFICLLLPSYVFADCGFIKSDSDLRSSCLSECSHLDRSNENFDSLGERIDAGIPYSNCARKYITEYLKDVELPAYEDEKKQKAKIEKEKKANEAKMKKALKIREKCAKKVKDYKNEYAAEEALGTCLQLKGYYELMYE
ncbi:hypothetical protein VI34_04425 [Methylophilales bacterium MBRSG12]|uniref:Uncharacterized protein n=1 Tax=Methylophilales bacterium MBRS-H7 TaxID=1623450 RepID=A0A0H4JBU7_9PROT|nr:hypothetical protein UZ34_05900 [Methylophilales bacterium MBRSF5]AKO65962.1 hypothetical protein VI33_04425 [Methylophilales bacterium MBRS-H7]AKO67282.1 hypothetical protein VI34_04425 [Methylophilales bacterium MBRSG12]